MIITNGLKIKFINFVKIIAGNRWKDPTVNGSSSKLNIWPGASGSISMPRKNKDEAAAARKKEMDHIMSLYKRMKKMQLSGFDKIDYLERRMLAEREEE